MTPRAQAFLIGITPLLLFALGAVIGFAIEHRRERKP